VARSIQLWALPAATSAQRAGLRAAAFFNNWEGKGASSLMRVRCAIGLSCIFKEPASL